MGKDVGENKTLQILSQQKMTNSKAVEILGITIGRKLSAKSKAGKELSALLRISSYLEDKKKKVICNTMIKSRCPLVWMFCSRKSNNLVNKGLERALRSSHKDNEKNFPTLLNENNETIIQQRNLQL